MVKEVSELTEKWDGLLKKLSKRLAPGMAKDHPNLPVVKEEGCYYYGLDGKKYLDFSSGIAVTNVGHRHPKVVKAIKEGADKLLHGPSGVIMYESILRLADELANIMPGDIDCFFFGNSGTEAIEGALKLAKHVTKRPYIISFTGCFHGRSLGALSVSTSKSKYRKFLQPNGLTYQIPYFDPKKKSYAIEKLEEDFQTLFNHYVTPEEVAAVILEPVLGEGGYIVPTQDWIKKVREICDRHQILLIFDEVQTGFGRTGNWFAAQTFDVVPDIIALAKGIASGLPLGVTAASEKLMRQWPLGSHATTFGGNPLACEAALAVIEIIQEEGLLENAKLMGKYAKEQLIMLKEKHLCIEDVRQVGLMIGIEIKNPVFNISDGTGVLKILNFALEEGVLFYLCGNHGEVIRMIPPLTVSKSEIDQGIKMLDRALTKYEKELREGER